VLDFLVSRRMERMEMASNPRIGKEKALVMRRAE